MKGVMIRVNTKEIAQIFKTLADESRVKIVLELLKTKELCACQLLQLVNCQQSTLSHHMKLFVESGIVNARKEWKWTHYSIDCQKLNELLAYLGDTKCTDTNNTDENH